MSKWLISVPVWGQSYYLTFKNYTAPAIKAALEGFDHQVRILIHTDMVDEMRHLWWGYNLEIRNVGKKPTYVTLQESHADAIQSARIDERVCLLNADIVISKNMFSHCEELMLAGKNAVVTSGIRTAFSKDLLYPIGEEPRKLLEWAWANRHQIIKDLEWGSGCSMLPTNLFFTSVGNVVLRGFHLHPIVVRKRGPISFISTIDGDLLEHFPKDSIHVVTSPDEVSMLEISPPERRFPVGRPLTPVAVAASMKSRASMLHQWLFTHRIIIKGDGTGCNDEPVAKEVLEFLRRYPNAS